jgi:hypothetical protein
LRIDGIISGFVDGGGEKIDGMEDSIFVGGAGWSKVGMTKFDCVRDDEGFGIGIHNLKATVVGQGRANVESVSAVEGP